MLLLYTTSFTLTYRNKNTASWYSRLFLPPKITIADLTATRFNDTRRQTHIQLRGSVGLLPPPVAFARLAVTHALQVNMHMSVRTPGKYREVRLFRFYLLFDVAIVYPVAKVPHFRLNSMLGSRTRASHLVMSSCPRFQLHELCLVTYCIQQPHSWPHLD